MTMKKCIKMP